MQSTLQALHVIETLAKANDSLCRVYHISTTETQKRSKQVFNGLLPDVVAAGIRFLGDYTPLSTNIVSRNEISSPAAYSHNLDLTRAMLGGH